jgi:hypothetical protein
MEKQTAILQNQIFEAEKIRKINFTMKHDELRDLIDKEDDLMAEI